MYGFQPNTPDYSGFKQIMVKFVVLIHWYLPGEIDQEHYFVCKLHLQWAAIAHQVPLFG